MKLNEAGQAAIEYLLMIVVMVAIMTSIFQKLDTYLISNPDSFQNKYLKSYQLMFGTEEEGSEPNLKWFTVKK